MKIQMSPVDVVIKMDRIEDILGEEKNGKKKKS